MKISVESIREEVNSRMGKCNHSLDPSDDTVCMAFLLAELADRHSKLCSACGNSGLLTTGEVDACNCCESGEFWCAPPEGEPRERYERQQERAKMAESENALLQDFIREVCTALGLKEPFDNEAAVLAVDRLREALWMYMNIGDNCSRGYLAKCEQKASAALGGAS